MLPFTSVVSASALWQRVYEKILAQFPEIKLEHRIFGYRKDGKRSLGEFVKRLEEQKDAG